MSTGPVRLLLSAEHGKAGKVCRLILDVGYQQIEFIVLGGQATGDGGHLRVSRSQFSSARVAGRLFSGYARQVGSEPAPALGESLWMSQHAPNLFQPRRAAQQAVADLEGHLGDDVEGGI